MEEGVFQLSSVSMKAVYDDASGTMQIFLLNLSG